MKTPAGSECKYFYGDYYRGRDHEECRLLGAQWKPALCRTCPVPAIEMANACEFMRLRGGSNPFNHGWVSETRQGQHLLRKNRAIRIRSAHWLWGMPSLSIHFRS